MTNRDRIKAIVAKRRRANPVTAAELEWFVGIDERKVREEIKAAIEEDHEPIASSTRKPYGFYRPATPEEVAEYAQSLKHRMASTAVRLHAFEAGTAEKILRLIDPQRELGI